jgi:hypothetical protein
MFQRNWNVVYPGGSGDGWAEGEQKGRMTAVTVEIRKESGKLVAIRRQRMTAFRAEGSQSKL